MDDKRLDTIVWALWAIYAMLTAAWHGPETGLGQVSNIVAAVMFLISLFLSGREVNRRERRRYQAQMRARIKRLPFCPGCRRPKQPREWNPEKLAHAYCGPANCSRYESEPRPVRDWPTGEKERVT